MNEREREDLQRIIEERRKEVESKKEVLERLKKRLGDSHDARISSRPEDLTAKHFLEQALKAAERARSEVARTLPPIPPDGTKEPVVAPKPTEAEIEVHIKKPDVLKIDKPIQTDVEMEKPPPAPTSLTTAPPEEEEETKPAAAVSKGGHVPPPSNLVPPEKVEEIPELTEDDKKRIMASKDFADFIEKTTLTLEKLLNQDKIVNIFEDYSGATAASADEAQADRLGEILVFEDSKFAARRPVQCLQTSPKYGHLFLATYGRRREGGSSEADGTCLVWSLEHQTRPQAAFTASSSVTCACFDPANEPLVYGGTAGGSLLLWDMRVGARPVQKTKVALQTHKQVSLTHQTYVRNLFILGSQHNRTLLSIDEENRCCSWSVSMVLTHQGTTDLKYKPQEGAVAYKPPADLKFSTTAAKARGTRVLGATQDGSLWEAQYSNSEVQLSNFFLRPVDLDVERWHRGPITNLDMQPHMGGRDDDLVLTSSTDWSVRLWDLNTSGVPLHTFETSTEFVFDVKWAPNHSAVFATGDGGANLCIWNLNRSWYQPRIQVQIEQNAAISRLEWLMAGKRVLAGTSTGRVHCAAIGPELSQGRSNLQHFDATLEDIRAKIQPATSY
eukprot:Gregarina_sp_Poly_1__4310@NODE_233_length_11059_cov_49_751365_g206_i0_p2_GENE_NODE_233_length_11059_cov_49_751365_g206_i0NODE_233_length_11059_cov_49_751365_g206_i0_p2_ORF_typecomplete_len614_score116_31ANAPC4_WD40/PF12894_7/5_4e03ANAPC4_WD40/PF12894_7/0_041ANAPC4_WD40/PF12894_7/0_00068ANAPC4_WD40/PF12894_7/0_12WD40_like/PF17005_5/8_4WD40_like/PF17005_5/4_7e06WD40/PF00400_32/8_1WD40/PF00400_32/26WD40/PF00400_32/0_14WD40/PF00400_32/1_3Nup160/PF11715_8/8e02Nup160/PF11715_8/0_0061MerRDNAbind/PF0927